MNLSQAAFNRARDFLRSSGRPLDRARFAFHFEKAPADPVLEALAEFRNGDGGFGRALEPDIRAPGSSALATGHALEILHSAGAASNHPLVTEAVDYLYATLDPENLTWRVTPPDVMDHPHAPWWTDEHDGKLEENFGDFRIIPRAQIAAYLLEFAPQSPRLDEIVESTVAAIESEPDLGSGGGDDLAYSLALAESPYLGEALRARLVRRLEPAVREKVNRNPEEWSGYVIEPLKLAPAPTSLAARWLEDILPANLDYRIKAQSPDGGWEPNWSWFGLFPDAWETARADWRGELTLRALLSLAAYNRINR